MKSANQRWKESGTNLSFISWIDLENKRKKNFYKVDAAKVTTNADIVQKSIQDSILAQKAGIASSTGYKTKASTDVLGLNRNILIFSTLVIASSLTYYFYKKNKK